MLLTGGDAGTYPFVRTSLANRADSVIIQFSDAKCTTYRIDKTSLAREGGDGLFDVREYDNYSKELVSQRSFTLNYSIDSTDYKRSKPCN